MLSLWRPLLSIYLVLLHRVIVRVFGLCWMLVVVVVCGSESRPLILNLRLVTFYTGVFVLKGLSALKRGLDFGLID